MKKDNIRIVKDSMHLQDIGRRNRPNLRKSMMGLEDVHHHANVAIEEADEGALEDAIHIALHKRILDLINYRQHQTRWTTIRM